MKPLTLTRRRPDGTIEEIEAAKLWERAERAEARVRELERALAQATTYSNGQVARIAELEGALDNVAYLTKDEYPHIAQLARAALAAGEEHNND